MPQKNSLLSLNLNPFLHSQITPNLWWPLFHSPFLLFLRSSHPSHLDFRMEPSQSHLLAGSHLQATTPASPVLLMFPQRPQFHPPQLFSDCLHLRWCCPLSHLHRRYSLPCSPQPLWVRSIPWWTTVHHYLSNDHLGLFHLYPVSTPLCHHLATLSWNKSHTGSQ